MAFKFDFIASSGRTATTYLAAALSQLEGVHACHEGYLGAEKAEEPLIPLINLENAQAFAMPASAGKTVAAKRTVSVLETHLAGQGITHLIDVAYYNATMASAILKSNPTSRMVGVIRNAEDFVRSATTLTGEDPLPVGWPAPQKDLTDREKFIGMGRIRPRRGSDAKANWSDWDAIRRNIWLWRETNLLLTQAKKSFPDRVRLCRFETFRNQPEVFWGVIATQFGLDISAGIPHPVTNDFVNKKPTPYQIGPASTWETDAQADLVASQTLINESADYDC